MRRNKHRKGNIASASICNIGLVASSVVGIPPNAYIALLFPAVLVLGGGPFGKSISFDRDHLIEKKRGQR